MISSIALRNRVVDVGSDDLTGMFHVTKSEKFGAGGGKKSLPKPIVSDDLGALQYARHRITVTYSTKNATLWTFSSATSTKQALPRANIRP